MEGSTPRSMWACRHLGDTVGLAPGREGGRGEVQEVRGSGPAAPSSAA